MLVLKRFPRYKGEETLSQGGRIKFVSAGGGKYSLVLSNIEASDGGKFSARAANEFGESRCTATLFVRGIRTYSHFDTTIKRMSSARVSCHFSLTPQ